jgi:hypothetical protein
MVLTSAQDTRNDVSASPARRAFRGSRSGPGRSLPAIPTRTVGYRLEDGRRSGGSESSLDAISRTYEPIPYRRRRRFFLTRAGRGGHSTQRHRDNTVTRPVDFTRNTA